MTKSQTDPHNNKQYENSVADFWPSARSVLRSHLGRTWPASALGLLVLIFWPIIVYWNSIRIDPAKFVEEWVKLGIGGVLLFLILEIMRHRSLEARGSELLASTLLGTYIAPTGLAIKALENFLHKLERGETGYENNVESAWLAWEEVERALSDNFILSTVRGDLRFRLVQLRGELDPARCRSLLSSLRATRGPDDFNRMEYDDLLRRMELFHVGVSSLSQQPAIRERADENL